MEALIASLANGIIGSILDKGLDAFKAYENKQISLAELHEKLQVIAMQSSKEAYQSQLNAMTQTYATFMDGLKTTKMIQRVWAYWMCSQITFLIWLEFGVPALSHYFGTHYPGVGALDQWAYAGVMAGLGAGPLVMKMAQPTIPK